MYLIISPIQNGTYLPVLPWSDTASSAIQPTQYNTSDHQWYATIGPPDRRRVATAKGGRLYIHVRESACRGQQTISSIFRAYPPR